MMGTGILEAPWVAQASYPWPPSMMAPWESG